MATSTPPLTKLAAWKALEAHYSKVRELHLRQLFADDPKRGECMTAEALGIYFDIRYDRFPRLGWRRRRGRTSSSMLSTLRTSIGSRWSGIRSGSTAWQRSSSRSRKRRPATSIRPLRPGSGWANCSRFGRDGKGREHNNKVFATRTHNLRQSKDGTIHIMKPDVDQPKAPESKPNAKS